LPAANRRGTPRYDIKFDSNSTAHRSGAGPSRSGPEGSWRIRQDIGYTLKHILSYILWAFGTTDRGAVTRGGFDGRRP
jgi:hypothetical protein